MSRVLYFHGMGGGAGGPKSQRLCQVYGQENVHAPRFAYPDVAFIRALPAGSGRSRESASIAARVLRDLPAWLALAQQSFNEVGPDLVVGSSFGGVMAMTVDTRDVPLVLIAPAWKIKGGIVPGMRSTIKSHTLIVHGAADDLIDVRDSELLVAPLAASSSHIAQALRAQLPGPDYDIRGRLIVVQSAGHDCNNESALHALEVAARAMAPPGS